MNYDYYWLIYDENWKSYKVIKNGSLLRGEHLIGSFSSWDLAYQELSRVKIISKVTEE